MQWNVYRLEVVVIQKLSGILESQNSSAFLWLVWRFGVEGKKNVQRKWVTLALGRLITFHIISN